MIDDYPKVQETVRPIFHADRLLPDRVFKKRYNFTLLADFDYVFTTGLIKIVHDNRFCDKTEKVLLSVRDPEPISYFHKHFDRINSFYFGTDITEEEYIKLLWRNPGNRNDALIFNSETVVWIPDNGRWAIWGERSREIAVIGIDDPAQAEFLLNEDGYWIDAETAVAEFAAMPYRDHKAPEDFARPLIENYGSRKDLERKLDEAGIRLKPGIWADE
ncbi:hypothetical protein [Methylocella tundrae]|nr:hypothetical protein [Methylocella tundrae]